VDFDDPDSVREAIEKANNEAKEHRKRAEAVEKEKDGLLNENQQFKTEAKRARLAGFPKVFVDSWLAANPQTEITDELVTSLKTDLGIGTKPEVPTEQPKPQASVEPTPGATPGGLQRLSVNQLEGLYLSQGPAAALAEIDRGNVEYPRSPYDTNKRR
jgi:hypothetical protein